ncbi:hypothetical protein MCELHM10_00985 [Paracoccaceae bacterium]
MSSSSFRVAFEGVPFIDGEIAVSDLAPALLALGEVVQAANRAINGDRAEARLKLRATNVGSFEALLSIDVSMIDAIKDLLDVAVAGADRLVAANQLMDLLLKGGAISAGVFAAVKFLRGKKPDTIEKQDDGTTAITLNHTTIIVDQRVIVLLEDIKTREAIAVFGEKALGIDGVESLSIGEKGAAAEVILRVEDREAFRMPEPLDEIPRIETVEREVLLKIITSHFRDGYKWRFSDGGEKPFTADIEDINFLNSVTDGKRSLAADDTLRCRIREEQRLTTAGLTKEIKVLEVIEHFPGPRQLRLL